jgi:quinol monooxygenase YgiN
MLATIESIDLDLLVDDLVATAATAPSGWSALLTPTGRPGPLTCERNPMSDIVVVAVIPAKPGSEDVVRGALETLAPASRQETGCHSYHLYESASVPGTFITVEHWGATSDLDEHMKTPHLAAAMAAAGDGFASPPAIHVLRPIDVD